MRWEGIEQDLVLKWEREYMGLCVATEHWEGLTEAQVLEMEGCGESRETRRAMMGCWAERDDDGKSWSLRLL
jgi:hypothetical protein